MHCDLLLYFVDSIKFVNNLYCESPMHPPLFDTMMSHLQPQGHVSSYEEFHRRKREECVSDFEPKVVTRIRDSGDGAFHSGICNAQGASAGNPGRGPREIGVGGGPSGEGRGPLGDPANRGGWHGGQGRFDVNEGTFGCGGKDTGLNRDSTWYPNIGNAHSASAGPRADTREMRCGPSVKGQGLLGDQGEGLTMGIGGHQFRNYEGGIAINGGYPGWNMEAIFGHGSQNGPMPYHLDVSKNQANEGCLFPPHSSCDQAESVGLLQRSQDRSLYPTPGPVMPGGGSPVGVSTQNIGANGGVMHAQYPFIPQGPGLGQGHSGPQWGIPGISTQYMYGGAMDAQIPYILYMSQGVGPGQVHLGPWGPQLGNSLHLHHAQPGGGCRPEQQPRPYGGQEGSDNGQGRSDYGPNQSPYPGQGVYVNNGWSGAYPGAYANYPGAYWQDNQVRQSNYGERKVYSLDKLRFESDNMEWKPFCDKVHVSLTNEVGWSDMDRLRNLSKVLDNRADEYLGRIQSCDILCDQKLTWSEVNQTI